MAKHNPEQNIHENRRGTYMENENENGMDLDYSRLLEINSSQEASMRQSETDSESAPMDQSDKTDTDKENQQPDQNLPDNKEPTKKNPPNPTPKSPQRNHGKENETKDKNNGKNDSPNNQTTTGKNHPSQGQK